MLKKLKLRKKLLKRDKISILRVCGGISGNLSATWFAIVIVAPGLEIFKENNGPYTLIKSTVLGIVFAVISYLFDRKI